MAPQMDENMLKMLMRENMGMEQLLQEQQKGNNPSKGDHSKEKKEVKKGPENGQESMNDLMNQMQMMNDLRSIPNYQALLGMMANQQFNGV